MADDSVRNLKLLSVAVSELEVKTQHGLKYLKTVVPITLVAALAALVAYTAETNAFSYIEMLS